MVLKIYGTKTSTCTQRVLAVLHEKKARFEFVEIDWLKGEHKSASHLKLHPFGKVPVLEDDGFVLFESRAIANYIARKFAGQGTSLLPADDDLKARALFDRAASLEAFYYDPAVSTLVTEIVFKKAYGFGEADEDLVAKHAAGLDTTLAVYEQILSTQKYIAGDKLTVADLYHVSYGALARQAGYLETFEKYPHVEKWFAGLLALESWQKASTGA